MSRVTAGAMKHLRAAHRQAQIQATLDECPDEEFTQLARKAGRRFGFGIPCYTRAFADSHGTPTKETCASQAIYHILIEHRAGAAAVSKQRAKAIAVIGVPMWQWVLRWLLKRLAVWVWEQLQTTERRDP